MLPSIVGYSGETLVKNVEIVIDLFRHKTLLIIMEA